jgi:hypothetical protein
MRHTSKYQGARKMLDSLVLSAKTTSATRGCFSTRPTSVSIQKVCFVLAIRRKKVGRAEHLDGTAR